MEGLLVGQLLQDEHWQHLAIISDDAGQFAVLLLIHGLCWVHAEWTIHKLNPGGHPSKHFGCPEVMISPTCIFRKSSL